MASWQPETPSSLKFEASPAESFLSVPGDMYPSLFGTPASTTLNPSEIMTPQSFSEDSRAELAVVTGLGDSVEPGEESPASDKKPTKKRKSWGQVLPEPKTNLPPRKRAKTEDEKEQRRVERVLRNRRAAQSSRERKRQEVEALEIRNKELEAALEAVKQANLVLCQELSKVRGSSGVIARNSVTFSQELFSSHDGHSAVADKPRPLIDELMMTTQAQTTINPTSLSPTLTPVPDEEDEDEIKTEAVDAAAHPVLSLQASPDLTQHPAAMLCPDLQCQSAEASRDWTAARRRLPTPLASLFSQLALLSLVSTWTTSLCHRPLTQIAMSLKAGFSLRPSPALLTTILWLVTTPSRPTSTLTTSSTKTTTSPLAASAAPAPASRSTRRPSQTSTLRLRLLRKLLTCSPMLARPLSDATMAALRLVRSERTLDVARVEPGEGTDGSSARPRPELPLLLPHWPGAALPTKEALLTLLWAIKVEERRGFAKKSSSPPGRQSSVRTRDTTAPPSPTPIYTNSTKRSWSGADADDRYLHLSGKRQRLS